MSRSTPISVRHLALLGAAVTLVTCARAMRTAVQPMATGHLPH